MDDPEAAIRQFLRRATAARDADLCLTFEAEGDANSWVQITADSINFALRAAEPGQWLAHQGILLPRGARLLSYEANSFGTYGHDGTDPGGVARFVRQYFHAADTSLGGRGLRVWSEQLAPASPEVPLTTALPRPAAPGAPARHKSFKTTAFWGLVIFLFCLTGALNEGLDAMGESALSKSGHEVDATLVDAAVRTAYYIVPVHTVKYVFNVGQAAYSFDGDFLRHYYRAASRAERSGSYSVDVPLATWKLAVATGTIPIVYLPRDPWVNRPLAQDEGLSALAEHTIAVVAFLSAAVVGAYAFLKMCVVVAMRAHTRAAAEQLAEADPAGWAFGVACSARQRTVE